MAAAVAAAVSIHDFDDLAVEEIWINEPSQPLEERSTT
jgi:hypothetical protein